LGNSVTKKRGSIHEMRITPKMADISVPGYHAFWTDTCNKLKSEYQQLIGQFPDTDSQLKLLFKVMREIEEMPRCTPTSVGDSEQCSSIVSTAEENRKNYYNLLYTMYGTYTVALHELKAVLKASTPAGQSLTHRSPLPPRRMASKKSGGVNDTADIECPNLKENIVYRRRQATEGGRHPEFLRPAPSI
jgi:hypothetical protein